MSPSAACAQPVDEPAIGIEETRARPTRTTAASSGLCQARSAGTMRARKASGTARFAASPASIIPGRAASCPTRPTRTRSPALNRRSQSSSFGGVIVEPARRRR